MYLLGLWTRMSLSLGLETRWSFSETTLKAPAGLISRWVECPLGDVNLGSFPSLLLSLQFKEKVKGSTVISL